MRDRIRTKRKSDIQREIEWKKVNKKAAVVAKKLNALGHPQHRRTILDKYIMNVI